MGKAGGIAALIFLAGAAAADAQTAGPEWTKFEIARERLGHKVVIDAVLANPLGSELSGLRIIAVFYSGQAELRRSTAAQVARIAPGQSAPVKMEAEQVPNFDRYEVIVEGAGKKLVYVPRDPGKPPVLKKASLPRLAVVSYKDAPPPAFPGPASVQIAVRNLGESEAQEPTALVSFLDAASAIVHKVHVRLAPALKALAEDAFEVSVPKVPEYASAAVAAAWLATEVPAPAEPPADAAEVAVRKLRILRLTDGTAHVTGTVHNGTAAAIEKVKVNFRLGKKAHLLALPGQVAAGAAQAFDVYVADCPPFEDGAYGLNFEEARSPQAAPPPEPRPTARRTGSKDTSLDAPAAPEKDAQDLKPKEAAPKNPAITVQIRGAMLVEGFNVRGLKTGDVIYLRLAFRDDEGNPVQPAGSFTAITYDWDKPLKNVPRSITKASWKQDAGKINAQNANHEVVAFDSRANELWVGLLRKEATAYMELRVDVKLTIPGAGTWTWKGLQEKLEAPARGPDEKEKK